MPVPDPIDIVVAPLDAVPGVPRRAEPVRFGVPLARGVATGDLRALTLCSAAGATRPAQGRVLDRWTDGSARWLLVDACVDHDGGAEPGRYALHLAAGGAGPDGGVRAEAVAGEVRVAGGPLQVQLRPGGRFPFGLVTSGGQASLDDGHSGLVIRAAGVAHTFDIATATVEDAGPVRAVVRLEARVPVSGAMRGLEVTARLHLWAASATVRCEVTVRNSRPARHVGGYWELGDPHAMRLEDVSLHLAWPDPDGAASVACSLDGASPLTPCGDRVELFQASSGGERWNYRTHANHAGQVTLEFRGYRVQTGTGEARGERATPLVVATCGAAAVAVTVPQFWQNCPQALEADSHGVCLRLLPGQHRDGHELQPGEQKTWVAVVALGEDTVSPVPLAWARAPLLARATPSHYCGTGAVSWLVPADEHPDAHHAALVSAAIEGPQSFVAKREVIDEYGWRNFGDLYADHESAYYTGPAPVVSHYNNQYDAVAGMAQQFLRSGDPRWWGPMMDLAAHVVDIDLYHTTSDRSAYDHGLFWHSAHYTDAGLATHRAYPRAPGIFGGGPSNEHCYADGLMLHYFLTGSEASRESAVHLAQWVVAMDDGRQRVFRWLAGGDTGLASASGSPLYHGPGRGAGNTIGALLAGFQLTRERRYLEKAEALVRRCIHPDDDIGARDLLNIEARWSYTVFLYTLGRYLDLKVELGEQDEPFVYGRRALLAYAQWMLAHERPYMERAAELEFPTETWVAQELWKSDVLAYAARYAGADEASRAGLLARSAFFVQYAVTTLAGMPTRTCTRPLVLLLSRGLLHGYLQRHPAALRAPAGPDLPLPPPLPPFEPQKVRAIRRFWWLAGVGGGAGVAGLGWLVARWFGLP